MNRLRKLSFLLVLGTCLLGSTSFVLSSVFAQTVDKEKEVLGVGMVRPQLLTGARLYFYNRPSDFETMAHLAMPVDSLVFGEGRHHVPISYAPPWFVPEYMNLDYDALLLRAVTISRNWIEVVVNTRLPRPRMVPHTLWVARESVDFSCWPDFLLNVATVEVPETIANPLRIAPNAEADVLSIPSRALLRPLAVKGSWLHVAVLEDEHLTGWIRWRQDDRLTLIYSLTM